ncbi:MAG TPA: uracil-DNA glycosylase [Tepidisphaeraceae bacterium]|jgi:DNA polymerase|nr:uracil-DNA glycosylase [Tepidisphaeraceae bacterium]
MADPRLTKRRLSVWLRGERAFGLESVAVGSGKLQQLQASQSQGPAPSPPLAPPALFFAGQEPPTAASGIAPGQPAFTQPVASRAQKITRLTQMDSEQVKPCTRCRLSQTRTHTVFGEGDPDASIFFIGEGPGENEDLQGRPFVGRAGDLLNKMIAGMGLQREQVYIANIVKCRPPGNRCPAPDEIDACTPYLVSQLEIIRPKVIVTLGLPASRYMLGSKLSMGKMRGQWHEWRGIKLMPTYHPAFLLRAYTEQNRADVWSDLKKVMAEVGLPIPSRAAK